MLISQAVTNKIFSAINTKLEGVEMLLALGRKVADLGDQGEPRLGLRKATMSSFLNVGFFL